MNSTITFDVLPATREDIPRLVDMFVVTCMADKAVMLNYDSAEECSKRGYEMHETQIGEPEWRHYKAVDRQTGVIGSMASWKRPTDDQIRARDERYKASMAATKDTPTNISDITQQKTETVINEWTHNHRHIYFMCLLTDPSFQRRGMGSALVKLVNEDADHTNLPILLRASPQGWPIYANHGYKVIDDLDLDLKDHYPHYDSDLHGSSHYRFRYMIRLPQIPKS